MAEVRMKDDVAAEAAADAGLDGGPDMRITVLTVSILLLIGILLMFTGYQAAHTERTFFREVAMNANQEIATLVGRQFLQMFTSGTGLVEDLARFPAAVKREMQVLDELFLVLLKRHPFYRVLYLLDENGKELRAHYNLNVEKYRPLGPEAFASLKSKEKAQLLSEFYKIEEDPALTFACPVLEKPSENFKGVVVAELNLNFIQDILASVRVGRTGEIFLASQAGKVIFSSPGFSGLDDFKDFKVAGAFQTGRGTSEYGKKTPRLAAYQRIHELAQKSVPDPVSQISNILGGGKPSTVPDWLVVVQQNAEEAYMVAERMKYNLIILVVVGVIGLAVIARLWLESL